MDLGGDAAHPRRRLETAGKLSHDHSVVIQQLPTLRSDAHLQLIARCERSDRAMNPMVGMPVPRETQKDLAQAKLFV